MGLSDTLIVLDDDPRLSCPAGHALRSFQTKDIDEPNMSTYLVRENRLFLAKGEDAFAADAPEAWRLEGRHAVREHRFTLEEVPIPRSVVVYGHCSSCDPVLVRTDRAAFGDIVSEHPVFVDFEIKFRPGEPLQVERTSGTRDDLRRELAARGVFVLRDDEPLAVAHLELKKARENPTLPRTRRRGGW